MIRLHPLPDAYHTCPYCQVRLGVKGWYIPGMRNLADLGCPQCGRKFYGDLPAGHGLYYPMLLEQATGVVHDKHNVDWFANWLRNSYANRVNSPIGFTVEEFRPLKRPVLLNCLDTLYGHCLLKLLNAQYYLDHRPELDLIVLVPRFLRWMVPDGVAAIWTVDLPLRRGIEWNDWLAAEIKQRIGPLKESWLSVAFSHPHPEDYDIGRFTRVQPFPVDEWDIRMERPTVTFIWREDRVWTKDEKAIAFKSVLRAIPGTYHATKIVGELKRKSNPSIRAATVRGQQQYVQQLAEILRERLPALIFNVVGLGEKGGFSGWINDYREGALTEDDERAWCEIYANSHVVIGVHGSNMLLPSAHAGAVVELVPAERWENLIQDILVGTQDAREAMSRYRFLPLCVSPTIVAEVTFSLIRHLPSALLNFNRPWCDHEALQTDPWLIVNRRQRIMTLTSILDRRQRPELGFADG